ncbi:MAG: response regulator transcription factor [Anaerolineales bacterium]|nr:MAG: response regulator transcription factor [Anaerolineales bacterium]
MQAVVVAGDSDLNDYLAYLLRRNGLEVNFRTSLPALLKDLSERPTDLVLYKAPLDGDPSAAIGELRRVSNVYLIVFQEQAREERDAAFLQAGADLILHLPVGPRLLLAYIQSLLRRSRSYAAALLPQIDLGKISLNPASRTVQVLDQASRTLTQLEFRLLYLLMTHTGQVMPPDVIVDRVWGYGESGSKELVRGLISRVRAKIEPDPGDPIFIHTLPGVGYLFEPGR